MSFFFLSFFVFPLFPLFFSFPFSSPPSSPTPPPKRPKTPKRTSQDHAPLVAERVVLLLQSDRGLPRRGDDRDAAAAQRRQQARRLAVLEQLAEVPARPVAPKHRLGSRERGGGRGLVVVVVVVVLAFVASSAAFAAPLTSSSCSTTSTSVAVLPVPLAGGQGGLGFRDLAREPSDLLGEAVGLVDDAQVVRGDAGGEGAAF